MISGPRVTLLKAISNDRANWRFFFVIFFLYFFLNIKHLQLHNTVHWTAHYRRWFLILAHYEHQKSKEMEPNWQSVQRCLAQKTKLIFNRFLPQILRWFSMDFYAESKLIFKRFLHQKMWDCQWIFALEMEVIFSRFFT